MTDDALTELLGRATPGPWAVGPSHVVARRYSDGSDRRVTHWVAECVGMYELATIEANAALIALAPDLAREVIALRAEIALWKARAFELETKHGDLKGVFAATGDKLNLPDAIVKEAQEAAALGKTVVMIVDGKEVGRITGDKDGL